jgi:hypothetical protein
MITGTFDEYEIWEQREKVNDVYINIVHIKQESTGATISIAKDNLSEMADYLLQLIAKDSGLDKISTQLAETIRVYETLSDWEKEFIQSVSERVRLRGVASLSGKQIQVITRIYTDKVIGIQD